VAGPGFRYLHQSDRAPPWNGPFTGALRFALMMEVDMIARPHLDFIFLATSLSFVIAILFGAM
jgi:hypothetical protein